MRKVVLLYAILIMIQGCSVPPTIIATSSLSLSQSTSDTSIAVNRSTPTRYVTTTVVANVRPALTATQTDSPMPNSTPALQSAINQECWDIQSAFKDGEIPKERLVVQPMIGSNKVHAIDFSNSKPILLPSDGRIITQVHVSPDGKRVVAELFNPDQMDKMIVVDPNGTIIQQIPYQPEWSSIYGWINNNEVVVNGFNENVAQMSVYVINPANQKVQKLPPQFPNINPVVDGSWDTGITVYDPSLQFVVYPELTRNGPAIVLWDIRKEKVMSRLRDLEGILLGLTPRWSPEGDKFFFPGALSQALTLIYLDGTIYRSHVNLKEGYFPQLYFYNWSPDGRYIAFWLPSKFEQYKEFPAIWDTRLDSVTVSCIQMGDGLFPSPVWSSDGRYLAVQTRKPGDENLKKADHLDTLVLDFKNHIAVKVDEDIIPLGWLIPIP